MCVCNMIQKNAIPWTKIWPSFEPNWTIPQPIHISIQIQLYLSKNQILMFGHLHDWNACTKYTVYLPGFDVNLDICYNPRWTGMLLVMWDVGIWTWVRSPLSLSMSQARTRRPKWKDKDNSCGVSRELRKKLHHTKKM